MRVILTKKDFQKNISIDGERVSFVDFVKLIAETQNESSTFSEMVITSEEIKIKTRTN